ncbi:MAG: TIGR00282 family metallophosphoesterase [Candidatus Cloacimonadaceae bacterium]|jgi:metallophosphoesterase (TIGR00282 family)|nr:TIGR00282 family metallophosphoesterase [Candidatus Cloacimonadota bacterium]MDD5625366.1 TIGR00282 family metallophosphoesterase [Candidatus Cloacimonadota bacterium]MDY0111832.1 TIGR00282 family metallophosphoesterase [Candidatus Syntrophosphaera sp.]
MIKILFFGDVFGKAGRRIVCDYLPHLKEEFSPDFIILNGENLADGRGLTEKTSKILFNAGVDAITGGNHLWDRTESWNYIRNNPKIIKPLNYPSSAPGNPCFTLVKDGKKLTLLNLCGQLFMPPTNSPFMALESWFNNNHINNSSCILIDFHSESTSEKRAFGWFVDGRVSAVLGTHTHIQTADEEILPQGTAYITDVGMTGAHNSVIGIKKEIIIEKFKLCLPIKYESSDLGPQINAVYLELDDLTHKAQKILRIKRQVEYKNTQYSETL